MESVATRFQDFTQINFKIRRSPSPASPSPSTSPRVQEVEELSSVSSSTSSLLLSPTRGGLLRARNPSSPNTRSPSPPAPTSATATQKFDMARSSNTYSRLEGGDINGPPYPLSNNIIKRFGWKKIAICCVLVVTGFWLLGPSSSSSNASKNGNVNPYPYGDKVDTEPLPGPPQPIPTYGDDDDEDGSNRIPPTAPDSSTSHSDDGNGGTPPLHPTSFETDPNPSKTTHCDTPFNPSGPLVQYALMIDAGSTGSRIHIYKFNLCSSSPSYEYETFNMTQPGLSSFKSEAKPAAQSLTVLLDEALRVVPKEMHKCTPVAVKATAGLRLMPGTQSDDILREVEEMLKRDYPFVLPEKDAVVVMDGRDEGVYAWITANYLLGSISLGSTDKERTNEEPGSEEDRRRSDVEINQLDSMSTSNLTTYAVLDLGGASTQIVFEPTFSTPDTILEEGEHRYELKFGTKDYTLYQHSYLGYGLMKAREHVHALVNFMDRLRRPESEDSSDDVERIVGNPCLSRGTRREVEITDDLLGVKRNVTMDGEEIGSFEACERIVQLVLAKDAICELKPCSFNGVYQPNLLSSFPSGKVLLLSYFYDRLHPLLHPSPSPSSPYPPSSDPSQTSDPELTIHTLLTAAQSVCLGHTSWLSLYGTDTALLAELAGRPEWCLDLTFMYTLLRMGYEFEDDRQVVIGKKIEGTELGWCLGATLGMIGENVSLKCRD